MIRYQAVDDGKTCADLSPTYLSQCQAGAEMRKVIDCSVIDILALELYEPVCTSLGGGFTALSGAYTTFVFAYAFCALILISGYVFQLSLPPLYRLSTAMSISLCCASPSIRLP